MNLAEKFLAQNDELMNLLYANIPAVQFNHYNLEVYLSIAQLCRQNLLMLKGLDQMETWTSTIQANSGKIAGRIVEILKSATDHIEQLRACLGAFRSEE